MYEARLKVALKLIIVSASKRKHKRLRLIPSDNSEIKYLIPGECWEDQAVAIKNGAQKGTRCIRYRLSRHSI
ncbi:hypothetical protein DMS13_01425 [Klebsiella variicola]|nr:hypothetical protein DMS13_01425 [Klebsiella variicola]